MIKIKNKKVNTGTILWKRAKKIIPGGNQLLSKRAEIFLPNKWPAYYKKAKGIVVWDLDGNKYYDYSIMGIGACTLGYANTKVDNALLQLGDKDYASANAQIDVLNFGYKLNKRDYLSFGFYEEVDVFVGFPKQLFTLVNEGNANRIGETFTASNVAVKAEVLGVLHAGISRRYNNRITAGARLKIYSGALNINSNNKDKSTKKVTFGFYNSLILFTVFFIALSKSLRFFQDFIIQKLPFTEFYINYFFESIKNIFEIWKNLIF